MMRISASPLEKTDAQIQVARVGFVPKADQVTLLFIQQTKIPVRLICRAIGLRQAEIASGTYEMLEPRATMS